MYLHIFYNARIASFGSNLVVDPPYKLDLVMVIRDTKLMED
jgi:hypothetical protein